MRRILALDLLLLAALAASSEAAQLRLKWGGCGSLGTTARNFACNTNDGADILVVSIIWTGNDLPYSWPGLEVAFYNTSYPYPASVSWWWLGGLQDCRGSAVTIEPVVEAEGGCLPYFAPTQSFAPAVRTELHDIGHGGNVRLLTYAHVRGSSRPLVPLTVGAEYGVARIVIDHRKTVGADACAGCQGTMIISGNSAWLLEANGTPHALPMDPVAAPSYVTWNESSTPVRSSTWGAIKSLYR